MIQFDADHSPTFIANKNYIEAIERELKKFNSDCTGFCGRDGYSIEARVTKNQLNYVLQFRKKVEENQSLSENFDSSSTTVSVAGLNRNLSIQLGKSKIRRLFSSKNCRDLIPSPFYLHCHPQPSEGFLRLISKKISDRELSAFTL